MVMIHTSIYSHVINILKATIHGLVYYLMQNNKCLRKHNNHLLKIVVRSFFKMYSVVLNVASVLMWPPP